MPKLEIGEYLAILEDPRGQEIDRLMIVPRKRFPLIGEAIPIKGKCFRVRDIQHPPDELDQFERFIYTDLVVYLAEQPDGIQPGNGGGGGKDEGEQGKGTSPASPTLAAVVIPFRPAPIDASSPVLTFMKLIAAAVAVGYQQQAYRLERMKVASWILDWNGDSWIAEELTNGRTADELRELSRAAKRAGAEAEAYCREVLPVVPAQASERSAEIIELAAYRRG